MKLARSSRPSLSPGETRQPDLTDQVFFVCVVDPSLENDRFTGERAPVVVCETFRDHVPVGLL